MNKRNKNSLINVGSSVTGASVGLLVGGPVGAILGSIVTPILGDVLSRQLSKVEISRINQVAVLSKKLVEQKIKTGASMTNSKNQEELKSLFEGTLLASRDMFEDKKIPLIANLFASAPFTNTPTINIIQTLKYAEQLSYQQLCILSVLGSSGLGFNASLNKKTVRERRDIFNNERAEGIIFDLHSMILMGLLTQMESDLEHIEQPILVGDIVPSRVRFHYQARLLFNGLQLDDIPESEKSEIIKVLS